MGSGLTVLIICLDYIFNYLLLAFFLGYPFDFFNCALSLEKAHSSIQRRKHFGTMYSQFKINYNLLPNTCLNKKCLE